MTLNRMHHPKADGCKIYIPIKGGERGMKALEIAYKTTTIDFNSYLSFSGYRVLQAV